MCVFIWWRVESGVTVTDIPNVCVFIWWRVRSQYEIFRMCVCIYMVEGGEVGHSMRYSECVCIYMEESGVTV